MVEYGINDKEKEEKWKCRRNTIEKETDNNDRRVDKAAERKMEEEG